MNSFINGRYTAATANRPTGSCSHDVNESSGAEIALVDDAFIDSGTSPPSLPYDRRNLLDYSKAAEYLGITQRHLKRLREYGEIEYVKVGRLVRFRPWALDEYVEAHAVQVGQGSFR